MHADRDGADVLQDLSRSLYGRMSEQCSAGGVGERGGKAYAEISLELVDVLVSRIEEMVADQTSDPLSSSSSFIAAELTIKDRVAGITAKGEGPVESFSPLHSHIADFEDI